jgi:hypothetical protein
MDDNLKDFNDEDIVSSKFYMLKNEEFKQITNIEDMVEAFDIKNRRIGYKDFGNGTVVSTVFLCIDHNFCGESKTPILFETMAWYKYSDYECRRYPTAEAALTGHNEVLSTLEIAVKNDM